MRAEPDAPGPEHARSDDRARSAPGGEVPFAEAADSAPAPVWMTDENGMVEFVNRAFQDYAGLTAEALMGNVWLSLVHPDDLPDVGARRAAAWEDDYAPYTFVARFRRADGEWRLMEVSSRPRRDAAGAFRGYVGLAIDITERTRAEAVRGQLIAIVESSSDAIISTDLGGVMTTWNKGAETLYGYAAEEAIGRPAAMLTLRGADEEEDILRRIRSGERIDHYETVRRRKDGTLVDISLTVSPVRNERGAIVGVSKIARDISERKRVEVALRESERRYRELVDGLTDAIVWEGDPRTLRFTFVSGAAERLLGYPVQRWLDDPQFWVDHMHPDDREWAAEYCLHETAAGRNHEFEYRMIAADGRTVWLRDKVYLSEAPDGTRLSRGIMMDITDAKRHEDALRAREAELDLVARMTPLALVRCDVETRYRFVNRAAAELVGLTPEQMIGLRTSDISAERAYARARPYIERALRGETVEYEAEMVASDGPRWLHVIYTPDRNFDGEITGYFASAIDVTQRKRDEEHKKLLIDELNHRVRNTLAVVQSIARQTFKRDAAAEASRRAFDGRLMALAKAHGLLTRTSWESAALADVVRDAVGAAVLARHRVSADGPDILLGPKTALAIAMALHELFTNALKYGALSNAEGRVEIAWSVQPKGWFELRWTERGGPPVSPPKRRGYGSMMIEQALARDLHGDVTAEYRPEGLVCLIKAPPDVARGKS